MATFVRLICNPSTSNDFRLPFSAFMRPRLLFVYLSPSTFVRDDLTLLEADYDVRTFHFDARQAKSARGMLRLLWAQLAFLRRELPGAAVVFGWFADYHLALPVKMARRAGIPVVVTLAGFDANTLPQIGHGVYLSWWRAPLARFVVRNASLLLPVARALIATVNHFGTWPRAHPDGVKAHVPNLDTPIEVIPFGFDALTWQAAPHPRPFSVLTVGLVADRRTFLRKGLDLYFEAARRLPEVPFRVIGVDAIFAAQLRTDYEVPENVQLEGPMPREALAAAYGSARVYAQLSRSEGLPNVLCEAMACACAPVGSAVAGIPEAIGDAGVVVETPEMDVVVTALRRALDQATLLGPQARDRIESHFSRAGRQQRLLAALDRVRGVEHGN